MKKSRILLLALTFVCAFGLFSLAACSGSGANSAESQEPQQSDEELITADVEETLGTYITKEELAKSLHEDEDLAAYEEMGMDLDSYAENMANLFKLEVVSVEVDGDTAVAKVALTSPNFGDEAEAMLDEAIEGVDVSGLSEDEAMSAVMGALNDVLSNPEFPTETDTFDIDYEKVNGTWTMSDQSDVESRLSDLGEALSGL